MRRPLQLHILVVFRRVHSQANSQILLISYNPGFIDRSEYAGPCALSPARFCCLIGVQVRDKGSIDVVAGIIRPLIEPSRHLQ